MPIPTSPALGDDRNANTNYSRQQGSKGMQVRAVTSGTLGSALEWFDFAIYGALSATIFPALFFSGFGEAGALLASLASFGVGFAARPLGGIMFGYFGDRFGRRPVLITTFLIMGLSSIAIGLLPTGQGFIIAVILVGLRFLQGFSLGGEATAGQLVSMEHTVNQRRGLMGSFINIGSPLSQVVANLVLVLLTGVLTEEQWLSWGWRIPFLASILLVGIGVYIRLRLSETPAFEVQKQKQRGEERVNGLSILARKPGRVIQLTLAWGGPAMTFYLMAVYGLSFLTEQGGVDSNTAFIVLMVGNGVSVVFGVLGGHTSDKIGRKRVMIIGTAGCFVAISVFFTIAATGNVALSLGFMVLGLSSVQFAYGAQPAFFAEQFPTVTRFSGSALSLTMATLIFAAPAPLVAAALTDATGGPTAMVLITLGVLVMSLIALVTTRDNKNVDLATFTLRNS